MLGKEDEDSRKLNDWAKRFGVSLPSSVGEGLLEFGRLLLLWGERINLTAAKSLATVVTEHLPDAFAIAGRLAAAGRESARRERIVDVGSGGGLPGIPLALLRPSSGLTLIEATGKKVAFLRTAVRELGLGDRVAIDHRRMDAAQAGVEAGFDAAISRAMLPPAEWLVLGGMLVRPGGTVFCLGARALNEWPLGLDLVHQEAYRDDRWVAELRRST